MSSQINKKSEGSGYISAIDGLRAVAILLVLAYHGEFSFFVNGFVGVDVFFVISGFLITRIITKDLENHTFSLVTFYQRRIRRIFPALFATLFLTFIAGLFLYSPKDLLALSESTAASVLSIANLYFHSKINYFDTPALGKPLLHIWSLSVEEQFYLFYPLTLFGLWWAGGKMGKQKQFVSISFVVLFAASLFAYLVVSQNKPQDTFYLPYFRAWELMAGGFIAIYPLRQSRWIRELGVPVGLGFIAVSAYFNVDQIVFRGAVAVFPVIGSAMVISALTSGQNRTGEFVLGNPLMVFIGKISYSLYLLHWPIIVFTRYYAIQPFNSLAMGSLLLVSIITSTLSWKFIETPFRSATAFPNKKILLGAGAIVPIFLLAYFVTTSFDGLPKRFPSASIPETSLWNWSTADTKQCDDLEKHNIEVCLLGDPSLQPSFALWGDSHAPNLSISAEKAANNVGISGVMISENRCPPILNVQFFNNGVSDNTCDKNNQGFMAYLENNPSIKTIIMASRWPLYTNGVETLQAEKNNPPLRIADSRRKVEPPEENAAVFRHLFIETVKILRQKGYQVIVVHALPEIAYDVPSAHFIASISGRDTTSLIATSLESYTTRNAAVEAAFQKAAITYPDIRFITTTDLFCPNGSTCDVLENNLPLYKDWNHLSTLGQLRMVSGFQEALSQTLLNPTAP